MWLWTNYLERSIMLTAIICVTVWFLLWMGIEAISSKKSND